MKSCSQRPLHRQRGPPQKRLLSSGPSSRLMQSSMSSLLSGRTCPLWDEFDREGKGVLDPLACTDLVRSYLHAMAAKSSEIIRGSIELGIELSLIISEKTVKDEATRQQMRKHARLQVEAIHANVAPLVQQMLDKMADEDPHTIAGELLGTLDFNRDGKVERNEFEHRFVESMQYVLGPEGLMDKLQRVNSLPQKS